MKSYDIRWTTALFIIILALNSYAGDDDSKKAIVPTEPPAPSRWSVSAGATVSSIKTSFRTDPSAIGLLGSAGIYNGGPTPLVYENGTVGPVDFPGVAFYTGGTLNASVTGRTFNGITTIPGISSDTEDSVGPYIKLAYDLLDFDSNSSHLSLFGQYTFTTAFDSGNDPLTNVSTTYFFSDGPLTNLVYNAALVPRPSSFNPVQSFGPQVGRVGSGLNIDMHTFTLGMDFTQDITSRVHLVVSTGPTLNLFYTGLASTLLLPTGAITARSDDSTLRFGWIGQLGVQIDLDADRRWFIETSGNYHWVTPFTVATAISSAKVQASSWGAELGLGYRF
jgi:hypothetical protein